MKEKTQIFVESNGKQSSVAHMNVIDPSSSLCKALEILGINKYRAGITVL